MKYFTTGKRQILKGDESIKMAQAYWGIMPLPAGAISAYEYNKIISKLGKIGGK